MKAVYAEDLPYWQTGKSSPDVWIERTVRVLEALGGKMLGEAFGKDASGRSAFMLSASIAGEVYRAIWPVMLSKTGNEKSARIQAATLLYHDIKARAVSAKVLGNRAAFFTYLQLPDGRTPVEMSTEEVSQALRLFALPANSSEDIIDGEVLP